MEFIHFGGFGFLYSSHDFNILYNKYDAAFSFFFLKETYVFGKSLAPARQEGRLERIF